MMETTSTSIGLTRGVRATLPLAVSVWTYGMVFGLLARGAGMNWIGATLMSILVNAGGSQFVALGLWRSPLPIITIILATLIVNLRHILMGASLHQWFVHLPARKMYSLAFFISDESWALTMREYSGNNGNRTDAAFLLGSGLTLLPAWVGSTTLGHLLGTAIPNPELWGLDFAFTAVFTALLVGMWKGVSSLWPCIVSAVVALLATRWLPEGWHILLGGLAGGFVGVLQDGN